MDAASGFTISLISYITVGCSVPELNTMPHFATSLYPFCLVFAGLLITSFLSRINQAYLQAKVLDDCDLPSLVLLIGTNRLVLIVFAMCMVPLSFALAYATTSGSLDIADISVQHRYSLNNFTAPRDSAKALDADTIAQYHTTISVGPSKVGCMTSLGIALGLAIALLSDYGYGPRSRTTADLLRAAGKGEATLASTASAIGHHAVLPCWDSLHLSVFYPHLLQELTG